MSRISGQSVEGKSNAKTKKKMRTEDKRQVLKTIQLSGKELEDLCSSIRNKEEELLQLDGCKEHFKKVVPSIIFLRGKSCLKLCFFGLC